eukprot:3597263-Rhodomonas_salina.3
MLELPTNTSNSATDTHQAWLRNAALLVQTEHPVKLLFYTDCYSPRLAALWQAKLATNGAGVHASTWPHSSTTSTFGDFLPLTDDHLIRGKLFALRKKEGGIRPILIGDTDSKVAMKALMHSQTPYLS